MEARAQYQNMTNMELISLLLQQEMDVKKQRAETEVQVALLEKREAELKKMKVQVRDLEDYIDKLLVRIMEQTPTLLQVRARPKWLRWPAPLRPEISIDLKPFVMLH